MLCMLSRLLCLPTYYNISSTKLYASEKQGGTFIVNNYE